MFREWMLSRQVTGAIGRWIVMVVIIFLTMVKTVSSGEEEYEQVRQVLGLLAQVPSGVLLLDRAKKHWAVQNALELIPKFRWARISKTDAVITRYFNPKTGKERKERKVTVFLKKDQKSEDLVLDLVHELVHATARAGWDPYDPDLTAVRYIQEAIEGEGGEADALLQECQVGLELGVLIKKTAERCFPYQKNSGALDRDRILTDFYRIGSWHDELLHGLGAEIKKFPLITSESPLLYSSTAQLPYPVALLREYDQMSEVACKNSKRRLSQKNFKDLFYSKYLSDSDRAARIFVKRRCF